MKLYSVMFVFFIQSSVLYTMETDIFPPPLLDAGILSSIRQLAQECNTDRENVSFTELRKYFELKNKKLLDQVSIDSIQKYLIDLPFDDFDNSVAPWLVNYWYDHVQDPHLIKSLSKLLMSKYGEKNLEQETSDAFVVDLNDDNSNNVDVSRLAGLVKKYAYSVKEMYTHEPTSIIISPRPLEGTLFTPSVKSDTLLIEGQCLRLLDGIEDVINEKMTDKEKCFINFVYFDDNKFHFPDVKRIKDLFPNLAKISYKNNPLQYIDEKDFDTPVGLELDFRSTHHFVHLPIEKLSTISYLKILFNKKNLTGEQIASLQSLKYSPDRLYYYNRNVCLEILSAGILFNTLIVGPWALFEALVNPSDMGTLIIPVILAAGPTSIAALSSIGKGQALCCYSYPYAKHDIILYKE